MYYILLKPHNLPFVSKFCKNNVILPSSNTCWIIYYGLLEKSKKMTRFLGSLEIKWNNVNLKLKHQKNNLYAIYIFTVALLLTLK